MGLEKEHIGHIQVLLTARTAGDAVRGVAPCDDVVAGNALPESFGDGAAELESVSCCCAHSVIFGEDLRKPAYIIRNIQPLAPLDQRTAFSSLLFSLSLSYTLFLRNLVLT